jgi:uroporphyrinogen decarboxylase
LKKETMSPRERWSAVINGGKPDRIPMDYWGTPEITLRLIAHLNCTTWDEAARKLHIDRVVTPYARYIGPPLLQDTNVFGVRFRKVQYEKGSYEEADFHPLSEYTRVEEIERNYRWPQPDWWDYSSIADQVRGSEEYPVRGGGSEPFLIYKELRGEQQAYIDLAANPEIVHFCLDKLFDLAYQNTLRIMEAVPDRVDICYIAEDMGSQKGLMISPKHIRMYLFTGMRRMIDLAHSAGAWVFHHNDGNITQILPDLVDLGIDILNPVQWRADGMDRQLLKQQYGDRLIFHGAVDNQYTLPFGSADEVRQEVLDNIAILGANGGYILAPCHNIQPNTPVENIIAMYQTGYESGFSG